jgi:sensor histidine kinase YesM
VRKAFNRINDFLDRHVLPWPVRFLTFRFVILATIALLIPLIVFAENTQLVLLINSYLNTMGVAVSSIVLLYATINERQQKRIAEMQEQRATEDHAHIIETHELMMRALANQHEEIQDLKEVIADMQGKTYTRRTLPAMPDLHELHRQGHARFENGYARQRVARHVPHNPLSGHLNQG